MSLNYSSYPKYYVNKTKFFPPTVYVIRQKNGLVFAVSETGKRDICDAITDKFISNAIRLGRWIEVSQKTALALIKR